MPEGAPRQVVRARTMEQAARQHFALEEEMPLALPLADALLGWHEVEAAAQVLGKIRLYNRMQFRRD